MPIFMLGLLQKILFCVIADTMSFAIHLVITNYGLGYLYYNSRTIKEINIIHFNK